MTGPKPQSGQAGLRWFILASVALNLFLAGVVIGPFFGQGPRMGPPQPPPEFMMEHLARDLSQQDAEVVLSVFAEKKNAPHERHTVMQKAFRELAAILRQDKPDLAALQRALGEIRSAGQTFEDNMAKAMQRLATEVSLEGRRKIADYLERGPMGGPPPHGPDGPPMRPDAPPMPRERP